MIRATVAWRNRRPTLPHVHAHAQRKPERVPRAACDWARRHGRPSVGDEAARRHGGEDLMMTRQAHRPGLWPQRTRPMSIVIPE